MSEEKFPLYRSGSRLMEADSSTEFLAENEEFICVDLFNPTEDDFTDYKERLGLHNLAIEDAMSSSQLAKLDLYDGQIFTILKTASLNGDCVEYGEMSFFLSGKFIIIVRHVELPGYQAFRTRLGNIPVSHRRGPDFVLHSVADFIVDSYLPLMQMIEDSVLELEEQMLESFLDREQITRIFRLRREVIHFQRVLGKMSEVMGKFVHLQIPCLSDEVKPYFNDVLDHLSRMDILVSSLIDVITSVFEASSLLEQQRQGVITRRLAAWAAILAIPTAIAGIYGMNFKNMPEVDSPYGYFIVLLVMALLSLYLYWRFKKSGWL